MMLKRMSAGLLTITLLSGAAQAVQCPAFPYPLSNGTAADATAVMNDFYYLQNCPALGTNPSFTGAVGIGVSSPLQTLDVANGNYVQGLFRSTSPSGAAGGIQLWGYNGSSYQQFELQSVPSNGSPASSLIIYDRTHSLYDLTIAPSGYVGIGTVSPAYNLHVNGSVAGTSAYNNLSDIRLKKDIAPIDNALATIEKLRGVRFRWRTQEERVVGKSFNLPVSEPQIGFVAQELKAVLPEALTVAGGQDSIMSVQESKVVPVLVEAVKQLKIENDQYALQLAAQKKVDQAYVAKLEKMEAMIDSYAARLKTLEAANRDSAETRVTLQRHSFGVPRKADTRVAQGSP